MDKRTFDFDLVDKYTPDIVIGNSLEQISEATRGYVSGNIAEYTGPISSYTKAVGITAALDVFSKNAETVRVDIQEDLGEQDKKRNRYEVFLTVRGLEHYKYRMMFVDYGAISYPVTIVLNEDLAIEYSGGKINDTFSIKTMKELEQMMDAIINSDTLLLLLQNLINEALRQEAKQKRDVLKEGEAERANS